MKLYVSVSVCSKAIAVTATRGCIGVWDYMTGHLRCRT